MSEQRRGDESLRLRNCPACDCMILVSIQLTIPVPVHGECLECGSSLRGDDTGLGTAP